MGEENTIQEKSYTFIIFLASIVISILGFIFLPEDLRGINQVSKVWIIYSVLNILLPSITLLDINLKIKWFYSMLFNPKFSLIHEFYKQNPKNSFWQFMERINNNAFLSFVFWMTFWSIPMFIGSLFVPQSAIGTFVSKYVFPVQPQSMFGVLNKEIFFLLFPAPSESGALVVLISATTSIINFFVTMVATRFVALTISFVFVGFFLSGLYWRLIHSTVSAGREIDAVGHTIFGIESGIFTIFTGQWTSALALHIMNLFFWYVRDTLSSFEFVRVALFWLFIFVFSGVTILVIFFNRRKKKKR